MAWVLNIDTSGQTGLVVLANNGQKIAELADNQPMQHASFLQPAIKEVMANAQLPLTALDAIAVSNGPGSYTGLRVGLASAKGICHALNKPLITLNSLSIMAGAALLKLAATSNTSPQSVSYCPMIDARRMEVFFSLYNHRLDMEEPPTAQVIDEMFLQEKLDRGPICFSGSGSYKLEKICNHPNAIFLAEPDISVAFSNQSFQAFTEKQFADLAYAEPFYFKEFHDTHKHTNK